MRGKKQKQLMTVVVDTREQLPYDFYAVDPECLVKTATLKTGDYSIDSLEDQICIERKTLVDAYGTFGSGRKRFERELERMSKYKYAAVIIEADWNTIIKDYPAYSKMTPKAFFASVIAWQQRYNVHFWTCHSRAFAERTTLRILQRFFKDNINIKN
jgi:ERCC4-type nuclease